MRVFKSRILRGIFGPKMDEITGSWRELHENYDSYLWPYVMRVSKAG